MFNKKDKEIARLHELIRVKDNIIRLAHQRNIGEIADLNAELANIKLNVINELENSLRANASDISFDETNHRVTKAPHRSEWWVRVGHCAVCKQPINKIFYTERSAKTYANMLSAVGLSKKISFHEECKLEKEELL